MHGTEVSLTILKQAVYSSEKHIIKKKVLLQQECLSSRMRTAHALTDRIS